MAENFRQTKKTAFSASLSVRAASKPRDGAKQHVKDSGDHED